MKRHGVLGPAGKTADQRRRDADARRRAHKALAAQYIRDLHRAAERDRQKGK